jgi:hypothetical protein
MVATSDEGLAECLADVACCSNDENVDHLELVEDVREI